MPTLVDSNILLDVITRDPNWFGWSSAKIMELSGAETMVLNVVIISEIALGYEDKEGLSEKLNLEIFGFEDIPLQAGFGAGNAHGRYRKAGGTRDRTLPDFLIGAHAHTRGHRLLTRDAGRYRSYFPDVEIIAPDTHP